MSKSRSPLYIGETETFMLCDQTFRVTIEQDSDHGAPWDEEDGHGPVSEWTSRDKRPGELILNEDRLSKRYYDFKEACAIARRDGWGVSPYRMDTEHGANGLVRVTGQWFEGRNLHTFQSMWSDHHYSCIQEVYAAHKATFASARAYAAAAAMQDFKRMQEWCKDEWSYVGVIVVAVDDDCEPVSEPVSVWGIESDADDYLWETAEELAAQTIAPQAAA